jgi:hypothetical protein
VDNDIQTLATALFVTIDDMLTDWPDLALGRPAYGMAITLSDADLLTMAVMSVLLRPLRQVIESVNWIFKRTA